MQRPSDLRDAGVASPIRRIRADGGIAIVALATDAARASRPQKRHIQTAGVHAVAALAIYATRASRPQ
jgi:hypothetical protein